MAFNYTSLFTWEAQSGPTYADYKLLFIKETATGWDSVTVDSWASNPGDHGYVYAQNYGDVFLITAETGWSSSDAYRSEDQGETWEQISSIPHGIIWLDAWDGKFIGACDDDGGKLVISEDQGATWSLSSTAIPGAVGDAVYYWDAGAINFCLDDVGVVHIIAEDSNSVYYTRSDDLGESWETPVVLMNPGNSLLVAGVASRNSHVCVGAIDWQNNPYYRLRVSHDNGLTWESEDTLVAVLDDPAWTYYFPEFGAGMIMDDSYVYILSSGYYYAPPENDPPSPWTGVDKHMVQATRADYDVVGTPVLESLATNITPESEGCADCYIIGNTTYGQGQIYAAAFKHLVPVNTSGNREEPYGYMYYYNTLRAFYIDGNDLRVEDAWVGNWPGPWGSALPNPPDWRDIGYDYEVMDEDSTYRFSSWRGASPGHLYVDNCQLGDRAGAGAMYSVGSQLGDRPGAGALYAVGCELGERNVE